MKRITPTWTLASTIVFGLLLVLIPVSNSLKFVDDDFKPLHSIAIMSHCRCAISDGGLWFFSHDYLYRGSIRFLSDDHGGIYYNGGHARVNQDWGWYAVAWDAIGCGVVQLSYIGDQGDVVGRDLDADFPGIYFRHFTGLGMDHPMWTLWVDLWLPMLISAILPMLWMKRWVRSRSLASLLHLRRVDSNSPGGAG